MTLLSLLLLAGAHASFSPPADSTQPPKVADSIYKLAVKPADYSKDAVVLLLDEGVYRVEASGQNSHTTRQVVQILTDIGARQYRERSLSWNPEQQKLKLNWMRVVKPSGEVIAEHPEQIQDSDVPAAMGTPMYTATKVRRISLSGLEPGTILDYSYTVDSDAPMMRGDFLIGWRVTTPAPVIRSNLVADFPVSVKPRITENNLNFKRKETSASGRTVYTWTTSNVPKLKFEPFVPDTIVQGMTVTVSPPGSWKGIGEWYVPIAKEAYAITPSVEEKMSRVMSSARTLDDSIAALHKWVAQDIRYVAIELGRGGYVPRSAETVVRTGFGDCKDKAMLFAAALKKIGVTAYPVLLNITGGERKENPSLAMFNHMITAVKRGNTYQFSDLTASSHPYGVLPKSEQGNLAVLVLEKGAEQINLPESAEMESLYSKIEGTLNEDGEFTGRQEEHLDGDTERMFRSFFQTPLDSAKRQTLGRAISRTFFDRADVDSLETFDPKDLKSTPVIRLKILKAKMVSRAGDVSLLVNPVRPTPQYNGLAESLENEKDRKLPFETSRMVPTDRSHVEARIKLPAGWSATLPASEKIDGPLGTYETKYSQTGDELRIERTVAGKKGIVAANRQQELIDWLRRAGNEDSRMIVLKAPKHSVASR